MADGEELPPEEIGNGRPDDPGEAIAQEASPGDDGGMAEVEEKGEEKPREEATREPLPPPTPEELAELREKAAERDEYLELAKRAKADFVNYRKRMDEERRKWAALAQRDLLARLLTACDQCSVAAKSAASDCSVESLRSAIALVWSELERFLKETGVSPVPTEGARFDPNVHQAVFVQPSAEHPDSTVIDEVKPGYLFGEHVLRPAQVVVTKRPPEEDAEAGREEAETDLEKESAEGDNSGNE